ncbi:hypothetical protein [Flavimarina sp. Hel_I_48]|uniref:hypothetical protein n=1 Tax=Flavimarina sp. Hel_I_48 TaxID=1392488 RepID=UPI0013DAB964|nr:hypothetical protein [Flavimarina sp. Hel_I_48]
MKHVLILWCSFMFVSCIPYAIAPKLEENHVSIAKRFQKDLPKAYAYIFEDPKSAYEFFQYIEYKFNPNPDYFSSNIPITVNKSSYYLSFYEVERTTKTINLVPVMLDKILENKGVENSLENFYESRSGNWYFAITITDEQVVDALNPDYKKKDEIVDYLKQLKEEYLRTYNYNNLLLSTK